MILENGRRLKNSSQNIPHASEELKENSKEWMKLKEIFAPIFSWITELVSSLLYHCSSIEYSFLLGETIAS